MQQKYYYDTEFFDKDNEESFYWAGFIAADGSIGDKCNFSLSLKKSDLGHLEKFKKCISSNANIKILPPKDKIILGIPTRTSGTACVRFGARKWKESLQRFGVVPRKTKTYCMPDNIINSEYFKHFIRGYFDGDGWFSITTIGGKLKLGFGLCGNLSVMQNVQYHLQKYCQIEKLPKIYAQKNIFKFSFQNQYDVHKIVDYLYSNSTVYLDRKHKLSLLSKQFDENTCILNLTKEELIEAYSRLQTYALIAKEFGCAKSTIAKYIKKHNLCEIKTKMLLK